MIKAKKAYRITGAKGKVSYKKVSVSNKKFAGKFTVAKNGKITVKKNVKKGTYKIRVKVTAKGNSNYKAGSRTVTVNVRVR